MLSAAEFPAAVDEQAELYLKLKADVHAAKELLDEKKAELVKLVRKNGAIPPGAEKSLRLTGHRYQLTLSFGTTSSINDAVVEQIKHELAEQHTPRLFHTLFHSETSYVVAPTATAVLENLSAKVRALFAKVMTMKPKDPSLKVEKVAKKGGVK